MSIAGSPAHRDESVSRLVDRGHEALESGDIASARSIASRLRSQGYDHPAARHLSGVVAMEEGRFAAAADDFLAAVQAAPAHAAYWAQLGAAYGRLGHFRQSADCFCRALTIDPQDADTYFNLAVALRALGDMAGSIRHLETALRFRPTFTEALFNLANAQRDAGNVEQALRRYRQAIEIRPEYGKALVNLGNLLSRLGRLEESVSILDRAARLGDVRDKSLRSLAATYQRAGRAQEALDAAQKAVQAMPGSADARHGLGTTLEEQGMLHDALDAYREALRLAPDNVHVLLKLGRCLMTLGRLEAAMECFEQVVGLRPETAAAYNNIGVVRLSQGRWREAEEALRKAAAIDPRMADARGNLGTAFHEQGFFKEALNEYDVALSIAPGMADARWNRALLLLRHGDEAAGWWDYEARWQRPEHVASQFRHPPGAVAAPRRYGRSVPRCADAPLWTGEPLCGESVLFFAEQGLGDTLQFVRFLAEAKRRGARTVLECQRALVPILRNCPAVDVVVGHGDELPPIDRQLPLMSLPGALRISALAADYGPYLHADPRLCERWKRTLQGIGGFRVGVAWQGNPSFAGDQHRSVALAKFAPLAKVPGVRLISVQQKIGLDQIANVKAWFEVIDFGPEVDTAAGAFMDTAAILKSLDLVVTSDSALPHLAGALGVETWLVLQKTPDWRWGIQGDCTPWYRSLRLFRQTKAGDWADVFRRVAAALAARLEAATI